MVSIRLIINDGIIKRSENAASKYSEAEANEIEQLSQLEQEMAKVSGEKVSVDFEKIKSDVLANKEKYLAKAAEAGQNTTSNKDIGIGTDGNIVNLDLWMYKIKENAIVIAGEGSGGRSI